MMAQQAALGEIANSKVGRPLEHKYSFRRTDVKVSLKGAPMWRGAAVILDIDEGGVAVKSRGQTFRVVRCCVRRQVDPTSVGGLAWEPASSGSEDI